MIPNIKIIGVGGGGSNAINRMVGNKVERVEYIAFNTDTKALDGNLAGVKILLGPNSCSGKGAEGNPQLGRAAAIESSEAIATALQGADAVFFVVGLGAGTGTGAVPEVARIAREIGVPLTAILATTPFEFEGYPRKEKALQGIEELKTVADLLAVFPNEALNKPGHAFPDFFSAFRAVDEYAAKFLGVMKDSVRAGGSLDETFARLKVALPHDCQLWMGPIKDDRNEVPVC
jgi:cell division protein FtsZ